jgi:predicted ATPase/DNA-binding XRE family transcriptional regulator
MLVQQHGTTPAQTSGHAVRYNTRDSWGVAMWDTDDASFGGLVRRRRRALDLTQAELGRRVGLSAAAVRKIEADERRPSAQVAACLADALAIPPDDRAAFLRHARGLAPQPNMGTIGEPGARGAAVPAPELAPPLSAPLTPLIGRSDVVRTVCKLLQRADVRLLTLLGPGGVGKTRVALQVAVELRASGQEAFPDGVFFVPLAAVTTPGEVDSALARELGLRDRGDRPTLDQLQDALVSRRMLVVLDNAEHLLEAVPHLLALLGGAPGLRLLVTSRAVLHVAGEHVFTVPPLDLPAAGAEDAESPAVRLFLERARAATPGRSWTADDIAAVAAICRQLDGLPLAIELAAARSRLLPPRALLTRLSTNPFEALAGGPRDLPARQRTLRATLDWSVGLLASREQLLLAGLGLFAGSWSLDLARAALGAELVTLDTVGALVDHSLVRRVDGDGGEPRFELLDVVRRFALERLAETDGEAALRERWALALLALAEEASGELRGPAQANWLALLDVEQPNMDALIDWALNGTAEGEHATVGVRLVAALVPFWWRRGSVGKARRWVEAALAAAPRVSETARAQLLAQAARLAWQQGEHSLALDRAEQALALGRQTENARAVALALLTLGSVRWYQGESGAAEQLLAESLALAEARGELWLQTDAGLMLALVAYHRGQHERREAFLARSLAAARAGGDSLGIAEALLWAGNLSVEQGALEQAEPAYAEARQRFVALRDREGEARVLHKLGDLAHDRGDLATAERYFTACLAIRHAIGDQAGIATALIGLGDVRLRHDDLKRAESCYREALALIQARGDQVDRAWAVRGLARVARARGELNRALQLFSESLRLAWAQGNPWGIAVTLEELGGALATMGATWAAGVLFGAADAVRKRHQILVVPSAVPVVEQDRAAVRRLLGEQAFVAALRVGRSRLLDDLIADVLAGRDLGVSHKAQ